MAPDSLSLPFPVKRKPPLLGNSVEVKWTFPGTDSVLRIEVAHGDCGNRYVNDVLDAAGNQFPWESLQYEGRSLVEVLEEFVRAQPDLRAAMEVER